MGVVMTGNTRVLVPTPVDAENPRRKAERPGASRALGYGSTKAHRAGCSEEPCGFPEPNSGVKVDLGMETTMVVNVSARTFMRERWGGPVVQGLEIIGMAHLTDPVQGAELIAFWILWGTER